MCNMACPTGVKILEMNARARATMVQQGKVPMQLRLRNNLVARAELLGKLARPIAPIANAVMANKPIRWAIEFVLSIHRDAPLPIFSSERFTTWYKAHSKPKDTWRKVVYFHGCSTQYYEPRVGRAAIHVLEANGFDVIVPRQNCCGLPLLSNGEFTAARRYHNSNVRYLVDYAKNSIPIVGTSTSCTLTLKEEAPELLDMFDNETQMVAMGTYDFNEFLLSLLAEGSLRTDFKPIPLTLGYHAPCQYRAHQLGKIALDILDLIPGLKMIDSHADCCGIAGTYGYKKEKYDIAMQVGDPLFNFSRQVGGPVMVCDSETCRWQITHATGIPAIHPVELLAAAYGFPVEGALAKVLQNL